MIERTTGRCIFVRVKDRSKATLIPLIRKYVYKGGKINSYVYIFWKVLQNFE